MPSGAASEAAEPPLLLLQQRLAGLGLRQEEEEEEVGGEAELRDEEDEEGDGDAAAPQPPLFPALLQPGLDATEGAGGARAVMAAVLSQAYGGAAALGGEEAPLLRGKSVNTTECVPVPSSEHVAEIVGRQGCKIKALRARTNTYIKTPLRGEEPAFVVTGRRQDVAAAKREILAAARHFSLLRAARGKAGAVPGQGTARVRVPYRLVGLVVGPRGATVKRIQQQTHTYIVTPGRHREPVFQVTGTPENVERARRQIQAHIALRTGGFAALGDGDDFGDDFGANGTEVGPEGGPGWPGAGCCRNGSSSSLGSGSTDSCLGGGRLPDFSPTSPFGPGGFWLGEALPAAEEPPLDPLAFDPLPAPSQPVWAPLEPLGGPRAPRRGSRPPTPRLSPTFPESLELAGGRRGWSDPLGCGHQPGPPGYLPAFSTGTSSYSSSNGGSSSSSPPECRRRHGCVLCSDSEAGAALVTCGHGLPCPERRDSPTCPAGLAPAPQSRS